MGKKMLQKWPQKWLTVPCDWRSMVLFVLLWLNTSQVGDTKELPSLQLEHQEIHWGKLRGHGSFPVIATHNWLVGLYTNCQLVGRPLL